MTTDNKITPENDFTVEGLRLKFDLPAPEALSDDNPVRVQAQYNLRTPGGAPQDGFRLNIDPDDKNQIIKTLRLDGRELVSGVDFEVRTENGQRFIVFLTPINDNAEISCDVELRTHQNTSGEGLYLSEHPDTKAKTYLTQNEEFGFRKIIPFPDRPSVAIQSIRTEVTGPTDALPELLSNGDLKDDHTENGRRRVVWEIDRPMPSYLFALVAGKFDKETDIYKTLDGSKEISLEAYADPGNGPRAKVALAALKKAMRFDEERYGFVYPYKQMKMAGVRAFNANAMENNTLVTFRDLAFLVDPKLSTDDKIRNVALVVAHEYFHTFTGNEVTVKSFAQPALKEGLTTYRESQFMEETFGVGERVRRIQTLRTNQFQEEESSLGHPIYPDESNPWAASLLYTDTTYRKGAFLYGVLHTLIGDEAFYDGMKKYRERFSGKAANFDDFLKAMSDASGRDLSGFRKWWMQTGTPKVTTSWTYDKRAKTWTLTVKQENEHGEPVLMPLPLQFIGANGQKLKTQLQGDDASKDSHTLWVDKPEQKFVFTGLKEPPVAAFGSHAIPVRFDPQNYSIADTAQLMTATALDPMVRYEAAQQAMRQILLDAYKNGGKIDAASLKVLVNAQQKILTSKTEALDPEMKSYMLQPPSLDELALLIGKDVDYLKLGKTRAALKKEMGHRLESALLQLFEANKTVPKNPADGLEVWNEQAQKRALRIACLNLLDAGEAKAAKKIIDKIASDRNADITERQAAVALAANRGAFENPLVEQAGRDWNESDFPLVKDDFKRIQVMAHHARAFERAAVLTRQALANPNYTSNDIEATAVAFMKGNLAVFHGNAAETYRWAADLVCQISPKNDRIAIRVMRSWTRDIGRMTADRQALMKELLQKVAATEGIGAGTREAVDRSLKYIDGLRQAAVQPRPALS